MIPVLMSVGLVVLAAWVFVALEVIHDAVTLSSWWIRWRHPSNGGGYKLLHGFAERDMR